MQKVIRGAPCSNYSDNAHERTESAIGSEQPEDADARSES